MKPVISHHTALAYWRTHRQPKLRPDAAAQENEYLAFELCVPFEQLSVRTPCSSLKPVRVRRLSEQPPDISRLLGCEELELYPNLDILVGSSNARKVSAGVRSHICSLPLARGSLLEVGSSFLVCSPEFCFLQLARELPFPELIRLGFELCGTYQIQTAQQFQRVQPSVPCSDTGVDATPQPAGNRFAEPRTTVSSPQNVPSPQPTLAPGPPGAVPLPSGILECTPLTSTVKLAAFLQSMPGTHGISKARKALAYVIDNSASPAETALTILLTLPYKYGGFGLPKPELNHDILVGKAAQKAAGKSRYCCDLYWPAAKLAVEYDSNAYHTGADRIASDAKKRNALDFMNIQVVTVTWAQIKNIVELKRVALLLAKCLGRHLRYTEPGFTARLAALHRTLLAF